MLSLALRAAPFPCFRRSFQPPSSLVLQLGPCLALDSARPSTRSCLFSQDLVWAPFLDIASLSSRMTIFNLKSQQPIRCDFAIQKCGGGTECSLAYRENASWRRPQSRHSYLYRHVMLAGERNMIDGRMLHLNHKDHCVAALRQTTNWP